MLATSFGVGVGPDQLVKLLCLAFFGRGTMDSISSELGGQATIRRGRGRKADQVPCSLLGASRGRSPSGRHRLSGSWRVLNVGEEEGLAVGAGRERSREGSRIWLWQKQLGDSIIGVVGRQLGNKAVAQPGDFLVLRQIESGLIVRGETSVPGLKTSLGQQRTSQYKQMTGVTEEEYLRLGSLTPGPLQP